MTRFHLLFTFLFCSLIASAQLDPTYYGDYWDADDSFSLMISAPENAGDAFSYIRSVNGGDIQLGTGRYQESTKSYQLFSGSGEDLAVWIEFGTGDNGPTLQLKNAEGGTLELARSMDEPMDNYVAPPAVGNSYKNAAGIVIFVPESAGNYVITFPAGMSCPDIPAEEYTFFHEEGIYKGVATAFIPTPAVERNLIFKRTGETMKVYFSPGEKNLDGICPKFLGDYQLMK
jgi:hypothetical protein